jgi:hypothetical protein
MNKTSLPDKANKLAIKLAMKLSDKVSKLSKKTGD